jgi:hypothetical protein
LRVRDFRRGPQEKQRKTAEIDQRFFRFNAAGAKKKKPLGESGYAKAVVKALARGSAVGFPFTFTLKELFSLASSTFVPGTTILASGPNFSSGFKEGTEKVAFVKKSVKACQKSFPCPLIVEGPLFILTL